MKKITLLTLFAFFISWHGFSQFGCSSGVVITNGYTASAITTPGTGGTEDWNTNPSGTSISGSYWDDDVYLFEYTSGSTTEQISMTTFSRNSWNGLGIFDTCTGTTFSGELDAVGTTGAGTTKTVTAIIPPNTTVYIATGQWGTPDDLDFDVTDFTVTQITCIVPNNPINSATTTTTADFTWDTEATATAGYDWVVMADGDDPLTDTPLDNGSVATGTTSVQVTGLTSATAYDFYVQSNCGVTNGLSSWSAKVDFYTGYCISNPTSVDNDGITNIDLGSSSNAVTAGTTYVDFTANTPEDLAQSTLANLQITFETGYGYDTNVWIDLNDNLLFESSELLFSGESTNSNPTIFDASFQIPATATMGQHRMRIGTADGGQSTPNPCYSGTYGVTVDFTVNITAPPACLTPTNIQNTVLTATTADFTWDAEATATAGYNWVVMADGDDPTTDTPVTGGAVASGVTMAQATGLTSATDYDFYVQSNCGTLSNWSSKLDFITACGIFTAPFYEDFSSGSLPVCWSQSEISGSGWDFDGISWNILGCSNSPVDHTTGLDNDEYAAIDFSVPDTGVILELPLVDVSSLTIPMLKFYMFFCTSGYTPPNELYVEAYDGTTWNQVALINTGSASWEEFSYDLSTFNNGNNVQIRFRGEESTDGLRYYGDMAIDDVYIMETPSCLSPTNVQNTFVTDVTADFSWDSEPNASAGYNWVVMADGDDPAVDTPIDSGSVATGTTTVQVIGLTAQTDYDFYVKADCGATDGLSVWSSIVNFTTNCSPFNVSFCENFDTTSTGTSSNPSTPDCWNFIDSGSGYGYTRAFTPNSGANSFYMYNAGDATGDYILVTPSISSVSDGNNRVNFWVDGVAGQDLIVGTMSNSNDASTFTAIQTVTLATGDYEEYTINIPVGTDSFVAFKHGQTGTFDSYYLDDICIEAIPSCETPGNIQIVSSTDITADFSWDAVSNASVGYNWAVMTVGDDPAVDTPIDSGSTASGITTAQAIGLTADTAYDFYVQADCGATDGLSVWEGPVNFATNCSSFSVSFCENFDTTSTGTSSNPSTPDCWNFIDSGSGYGYTRAFTPNSGANSFYMYNGSDLTGDYILITPPISNVSDGNNRVNFWVDGVAGQDLIIGTMSNSIDASTFTAIQTVTLATGSYEEYTINIPVGTDNFIAFKHGQTGTFDAYYLDDICIEAKPSCETPVNIQSVSIADTTADFSWDAVSNASAGYNWAVMALGDDPAVDTPIDSGSTASGITTAQAIGLTTETDYDFYVQVDCGITDGLSDWEGPISFTTLCAAYIVTPMTPFEEDFTASSTPLCWSETGDTSWEYSVSTPGYAAASLADHTPGGGTVYAVMDGSDNTDGETGTLVTPLLDVSALTSPALTFYAFSDNTNDAAINILDVEFYDGASWNTVLNQTTLLGANWVEFNFDLSNYTITGNVKVRFTVTGSSNGGSTYYNDIIIDDVSVYEFSCATPSNPIVSNITTSSADFNWTASPDETNGYEYIVMLNGDTPGVDTPAASGILATGTTMVSVSSLSPGVDYDFYVRTICSLNGPWSPVVDFTTALPPCDLPTGITNTAVTLTTADFSWTASADETNGYIWLVMADGDDPLVDMPLDNGTVATGVTTLTVNGLTPAINYDFYIQTDCGGGTVSIVSNKVDFMTDTYPCTPPSSISNNAITETTAKLTWQTNGLETGGYNWVLMADGDDPTTDMPLFDGSVGTGITSVIISGLTPMTSYDFYVQTICVTEDSGWSFKVDITTAAPPCAAPIGVIITDVQDTTADFSWTASPDETDGYSWFVMIDGEDPMVDSPVQQGAVATGVNNVQVTGLTKDTEYDFYVRTDCGSGNMSDWSTKIDFMTTDLRTSISNFQNFSYYPNPVKSTLVLEASIQEMQKVSVYNLLGQEVISIQPNSLKTNLNLEKLAAGPYMIVITINGELKTFKIIKE